MDEVGALLLDEVHLTGLQGSFLLNFHDSLATDSRDKTYFLFGLLEDGRDESGIRESSRAEAVKVLKIKTHFETIHAYIPGHAHLHIPRDSRAAPSHAEALVEPFLHRQLASRGCRRANPGGRNEVRVESVSYCSDCGTYNHVVILKRNAV